MNGATPATTTWLPASCGARKVAPLAAMIALLWLAGTRPALASPATAATPPPAAALRARLLRNFTADQSAEMRYRHVEHIVIDKNHRLEGRTVAIYYVHGHEVPEIIALDSRQLKPAELAGQRAAARKRAQFEGRQPRMPPGGLAFNHRYYSFARLAGDYLYGPASVRRWHGRLTWVYPARPNPAVRSRSKAEQILLSSRGSIWVDAHDLHICRIEVSTFQPVRYWLGFLATVHNAGIDLELQRHGRGLWLPAYAHFWVNATILLFKSFTETKTQSFSHWRLLAKPAGSKRSSNIQPGLATQHAGSAAASAPRGCGLFRKRGAGRGGERELKEAFGVTVTDIGDQPPGGILIRQQLAVFKIASDQIA